MFDSNVLLAAPVSDGTPPALVFECAGDLKAADAVTVRLPGEDKMLPGPAIACANHFRKRPECAQDDVGRRYRTVARTLGVKGQRVDFATARDTLQAASVSITMHSVVADLNTRDFWYAAGEMLAAPSPGKFVKLPVKEWLEAR